MKLHPKWLGMTTGVSMCVCVCVSKCGKQEVEKNGTIDKKWHTTTTNLNEIYKTLKHAVPHHIWTQQMIYQSFVFLTLSPRNLCANVCFGKKQNKKSTKLVNMKWFSTLIHAYFK